MTYYELNSIYGHDTFLLDLNGVGAAVKVGHHYEHIISLLTNGLSRPKQMGEVIFIFRGQRSKFSVFIHFSMKFM